MEKVNLGYSKSINTIRKKLFVTVPGKNRNGDQKSEVKSNAFQPQ